jgi:hypothetical protein
LAVDASLLTPLKHYLNGAKRTNLVERGIKGVSKRKSYVNISWLDLLDGLMGLKLD